MPFYDNNTLCHKLLRGCDIGKVAKLRYNESVHCQLFEINFLVYNNIR